MAKRATASNKSGKGAKAGKRSRNLPNTTHAQEQEIQRTLTAQEALEKHAPTIKKLKADLRREQEAAKKVVGAANGAYRSSLKAFKKDGGNINQIIRILEDMDRDADEVIKDNLDYARYAAFFKLPIGEQAELFEGTSLKPAAKTSAPEAEETEEEEVSPEQRIARAKTEGFEAGSDGKSPSNNPYEDGSPEFLAWSAEWRRAQDVIAAKFGGKQPTHEAAHA
ncbi:MAG TPA: hypothetical protein VG271_13485 [Beijerinckiaceae bacterium]|jgi:ribosome modulation factor|nr:hypothetical protein [Beijerinckiaceae bacterium]